MRFKVRSVCEQTKKLVDEGGETVLEVNGVYSNAVYLKARSHFITIASQEQGNFPYGVLLNSEGMKALTGIGQKEWVVVEKESFLFLPSRVCLDFSESSIWVSATLNDGKKVNAQKLGKNLNALKECLFRETTDQNGFAFVSGFMTISDKTFCLSKPDKGTFDHFYAQSVVPILMSIQKKWRLGKHLPALEKANLLVGLGPGLTPSGDDFLIGMMASITAGLPQHSSLFLKLRDKRMGLNHLDRGRTTEVSRFFLTEAAVGGFPETLVNTVRTVYDGESYEMIKRVQQLKKIGSTSGMDMATGVLFGAGLTLMCQGLATG